MRIKLSDFKIIIPFLLMFVSAIMLFLQYTFNIFTFSDILYSRLYAGGLLTSAIIGIALMFNKNKLKVLIITSTFATIIILLVGGTHLLNDMSSGATITAGSMWYGLDAITGTAQMISTITDGIVKIVPIGILIFGVIAIFTTRNNEDRALITVLIGIAVTFVVYFMMSYFNII